MTDRKRTTRIGVYGLIRNNNQVLLCRLSGEVVPHYQGWWTLPGGGMEFGEHPEETLVREVLEETGLTVRPSGFLGANSFTINNEDEDFHSLQFIYAAEVISGTLANELDGTTDLCAWQALDDFEGLPIVGLVKFALAF